MKKLKKPKEMKVVRMPSGLLSLQRGHLEALAPPYPPLLPYTMRFVTDQNTSKQSFDLESQKEYLS